MIRLLLGLSLLSVPAQAQTFLDLAGLSPYTQYKQFETEHFTFTYQKGYFEFTKRAATHLEHAHALLSPLLKWQPRTRTHVLVADNEDAANGFAAPALRVGMVLIATPPESWSSTSYSDDWIKFLVFHEYTHILNLDPTTEWMEVLRILFGDVIRPNNLWPTWMIEGLAVYYETRTGKRGRGRSPYYEALLRAFLLDGKLGGASGDGDDNGLTLDRINGDYPGFPGGEIPYLFGYELWNQMTKEYQDRVKAEDAMGEISLRSSARIPFFINGNQENVTGKDWHYYWDRFLAETRARLDPQIEQIRAAGVTPFEAVTSADYSALGGVVSPDLRWLAYTKSSTDRRTGLYLVDLKTREEIRVDDKIQGVGLAWTKDSRHLIYSTLVQHNTYQLYSDLFDYEMLTGNITRLSEGLRLKDPAISPDGRTLAFIKVQQGTHTLWTGEIQRDEDGIRLRKLKIVYRPNDLTILGTPKFLTEDRVVFSEQKVDQSQSDILQLDLRANQTATLLADGAMNRGLATHANRIYFVSDASGVDEIYRIRPNVEAGTALPERQTRVLTGTALPFVASNGELWASVLTSRGYQIGRFAPTAASLAAQAGTDPVTVPPNAPETMEVALAEPPALGLDESNSWDYQPWSSLAPRQWAPLAYFSYSSRAGFEAGSSVLGFDSTGKHQYFALLGYQFLTKEFQPFVAYTYYGFRPAVTLSASSDVFDIGFEGLDYYKKSSDVTLMFSYPIRWTFSSLVPTVYFSEEWNAVRDLNTKERVANDDPDYNRNQIPAVGANLVFENLERSRFGFMPERGQEITLAGLGRQYDRDYALWKYLVRYQHYFPVGEHSVLSPTLRWLGSSRTLTSGVDRFYSRLEGKRSGDITDRGTSSSLSSLGIRGYFIDSNFSARNAGVASLDYHFPIDRVFRGSGTLPAFLRQVHGFVFADMAYVQRVVPGYYFLPAFGGGVSFDTTLFLRAPVRFNLEYQHGTRKDLRGQQNVIVTIEADGLF